MSLGDSTVGSYGMCLSISPNTKRLRTRLYIEEETLSDLSQTVLYQALVFPIQKYRETSSADVIPSHRLFSLSFSAYGISSPEAVDRSSLIPL